MGFFLTHLAFWLVIDVVFQPGVIKLKVDKTPAIVYDTNDKSWAIPAYDNIKHIAKCIERDNSKCLRGE